MFCKLNPRVCLVLLCPPVGTPVTSILSCNFTGHCYESKSKWKADVIAKFRVICGGSVDNLPLQQIHAFREYSLLVVSHCRLRKAKIQGH